MAAAIAGALLPLAFAPYGWWPLAVGAPALLLVVTHGQAPRQAALLGWLFGFGMFGHGVWWIQVSVHQFGIPYYTFSVTMTAIFVAGMALYPALYCALLARLCGGAERSRLLAAAGLWPLLEWVRGWFLSGFPWLSLGYSQTDGPLAPLAPVLGVFGVSFLLAALASALVAIVRGPPGSRVAAALVFVSVGVATLTAATAQFTRPLGEPLRAALIQGAIPQALKWQPQLRERSIELYRQLSAAHWQDDIVVWPETAIAAFPHDVGDTLAELAAHAGDSDTDLLVGMPTGKPWEGEYYNSLVKLGPEPGRYDKRHLVPFGEFFPLGDHLERLARLLTIPLSDFSAGDPAQAPITVAGHAVGTTICYEDAFGGEARTALPGAALLVNVSNDAWFGDTIAPHQHLQIARMRALEAGRWMLRATNTGISAIIDYRGAIVSRAPAFTPATTVATIELRQGATPYARYGEAPVLVIATLALGAGAVSAARSRRGARAP